MPQQCDGADRSSFYRTLLQKRSRQASVPLARFCRDHGISIWTWYYWKKRLGHKAGALKKTPPPVRESFLPVSVLPSYNKDQPFIEVRLRDGTIVRVPGGFDKEIFRAIIETFSPVGVP